MAFLKKIGEHTLQIHCDSIEYIEWFDNHFQSVHDINSITDIIIYLRTGYGLPFINYDVGINRRDHHIFFRRADYLIEVDEEFQSAVVSVHDELALKHALMNLYSSFIVYQGWGLLVHSSCVIENDQCHLFAGPSGAGKSTAARLSSPRELLSDEATILKITTDKISVFDSPFRSELQTNGFDGYKPLASIQLLHQASENRREKLKKSEALIQLVDKVFYWPHDSKEIERIIDFLKNVANNIPVFDLYFQKNNTFWELIS